MGHGIYFWESDPQHALQFAQETLFRRGKSNSINKPAVVGAILDIGFCLDLLKVEHIGFIKNAYTIFMNSCKELRIAMPENIHPPGSVDVLLRNLDCAVIEDLHFQRQIASKKPFDSLRSAFIEGEPVYPNAGFYTKNHIQLCIRNPNCIKGYFLPRTINDQWPVP